MRTPTLLALLTRRGRPGNESGQPETHAREMLDRTRTDALIILVLAAVVYVVSALLNLREKVLDWLGAQPIGQLDQLFIVGIFLSIASGVYAARRWRESVAHHQELLEARERLRRVEHLAELGKFGAGIAHEMRKPLGVMINATFMVRRRLGEIEDEKLAHNLDVLDSELERAERIASDLLKLARLKAPAKEPVDLSQIVRDCMEYQKPPESVEVRLELAELPAVQGDPGQLLPVLVNLTSNALQAMPQGGRLTVGTRASDGRVEIVVADTGPGIDPEVRDRLFEPLVSTREEGTGLGLALSKAIVEAHGGRIDVETTQGQGATFTVNLPTAD